jgi:hypothetical protein
VTLALLIVAAIAASGLALSFDRDRRRERALERRERAWETERKDLLDRLMYLSDHTWAIPPADLRPSASAQELLVDPDEKTYDPLYQLPGEMN